MRSGGGEEGVTPGEMELEGAGVSTRTQGNREESGVGREAICGDQVLAGARGGGQIGVSMYVWKRLAAARSRPARYKRRSYQPLTSTWGRGGLFGIPSQEWATGGGQRGSGQREVGNQIGRSDPHGAPWGHHGGCGAGGPMGPHGGRSAEIQ